MAIPTAPPFDYKSLFAIENERLLCVLSSLSVADWQRPTRCPGWDVHGLALHLVGGSFSVVSWLRDGFRGTPAPNGLDDLEDLDEQGFIGWLDGLQTAWVEAARRVSPRLLIELLGWVSVVFDEALSSQDPSAVSAHVSWAGNDPVPVWLDHARELSEKWIHRQQILEALGEPTDLRPDLARPVLEALRWAYPYRLGTHTRELGTFVEIEILDELIGQRWMLVSNGTGWVFDDGTPAARVEGVKVGSMSLSGEQAWRLPTNNYEQAVHGIFHVAGEPDIVAALTNTRAIIGTAK